MKRRKKLLRQPGIHIFIFFLFFVLINWPFLTITGHTGLLDMFIYLFLIWGIVVLLLFFISRDLRDDTSMKL